MQLLKKLSVTHAAITTKTSIQLLARGKSTAQSVGPALATIGSSPTVEPLVRAAALYALALLLMNHSTTKMNQAVIEKITPVLVNASLVGGPMHSRGELEKNNEDIENGITTKRKSGWIDNSPFKSGSTESIEFIENEKFYRKGMARVEGSATAILQRLRSEKKKERDKVSTNDNRKLRFYSARRYATRRKSSTASVQFENAGERL